MPDIRDVKQVILGLVAETDRPISARDVLDALDRRISRQAVHGHLSELVDAGLLIRDKVGRSVRYQRAYEFTGTWPRAGLREDAVWAEVAEAVPAMTATSTVRTLVNYLVTELVNNAIDHSEAEEVEVRVAVEGSWLRIEVRDAGVGVFFRIADGIDGVGTPLEAAQHLTRGKVTTFPERHTGEGIFFSSRASQQFYIDANGVRLTIDTERDDWALGVSGRRAGSAVAAVIDLDDVMPLTDLFRRFTTDHEFDETETVIALFRDGAQFVSRSEAKRVAAGLEKFRRVELDFSGVEEVGQGFVDELFRVWAIAHPDVQLVPTNANEAVKFMIDRGTPST